MSMRFRTVLICLVFAALVWLPASVRADWHVIEHESFNYVVYGLTYLGEPFGLLATNQKLRLDWTSADQWGPVPVDFMIMDGTNWAKFEAGQNYSCEVIHQSVTSEDYTWTVPYYREWWYVVWDDRRGPATWVAGDWYVYDWFEPANLQFTAESFGVSCRPGQQLKLQFEVMNYGEETFSGLATLEVGSMPTDITVTLTWNTISYLPGDRRVLVPWTLNVSSSCALGHYYVDVYLKVDSSVVDTDQIQIAVTPGLTTATTRTDNIPGFPFAAVVLGVLISTAAAVTVRRRREPSGS